MKYKLDDFINECKGNYFKNITPGNKSLVQNESYQRLVNIAIDFFTNNKIEEFTQLFFEGKYYIELWAAHFILEYGKPDNKTEAKAIEIVKKYSQSPLSIQVADEEKDWIKEHIQID